MKVNIYIFNNEIEQFEKIFNNIGHLKLILYFDTINRILSVSDQKCEVGVVVLQKDIPRTSNLKFPIEIVEDYYLLDNPNVIEVEHGDENSWPDADIVFMPYYLGTFPFEGYSKNPPEWMSREKIIEIEPVKFYTKLEITYNVMKLLSSGIANINLRTFILLQNGECFLSNNILVDNCNNEAIKLREELVGIKMPTKFQKYYRVDESINVVIGGIYKKFSRLLNLSKIESYFTIYNSVPHIDMKLLIELIEIDFRLLREINADYYYEDPIFIKIRKAILFIFFPDEVKGETINEFVFPENKDELIAEYELNRLVNITVQVGKKVRGSFIIEAKYIENTNLLTEKAADNQDINKYLNEGQIKAVRFIEKNNLLSIQLQ